MSYPSGMLNKRIQIYRRATEQESSFGKSGQPKYELVGTFWAAETHAKGAKALQEGAFDAYDKVMFRLRYTPCIDRWSIIKYDDRFYQILDFKPEKQANTIQIITQEMVNPPVIVETKQ